MAVSSPQAQSPSTEQPPFLKLLAPAENQLIISKKPHIEIAFTQPIDTQTLLVMLDGVDISQVVTLNPRGFSYQPIQVLEPGNHTLMISGNTVQGELVNQEFSFSTRHYTTIEKGFSENEITLLGQTTLGKSESREELVPDKRFEANLRTASQLKEKGFDLVFNANLKFMDQDIPAVEPEKKGLDLIDFLLSADYAHGSVNTHAEFGDTLIDLSPNTLSSLGRRGAQLSLGSDRVKVGGFSVNSAQTYGYDGESGVSQDLSHHVHGLYGDLNLLDNRLKLRTIYTTGGEKGDSFGTAGVDRNTKGHAIGAVLTTDFFEGKLVSEFEIDNAEFDADTTDSQAAKSDNAYRLLFLGGVDRYTYSAVYKYFGADYEVVGNQGLEKDRAGFELNGGAAFEKQSMSANFSQYQDNVDDDPTRPVIQTRTASLNYAYTGMERFPLSLTYQKEISESSKEPADTYPVDYQTDSVAGSVSYLYSQWNIALQGNYALRNDLTAYDADTTTTQIVFMPQYSAESIFASTSLGYNQAKDHATDIRTDSRTIAMNIQGRLFNEKFSYGLGGTLDYTTTSDDSVDQRTTAYFFNLNYILGRFFRGLIVPSLGLKGESNEIYNCITDETTRDYVFTLTLSATSHSSF